MGPETLGPNTIPLLAKLGYMMLGAWLAMLCVCALIIYREGWERHLGIKKPTKFVSRKAGKPTKIVSIEPLDDEESGL